MRNSICVIALRLIMKIRTIFVDVFLTLYLWDLSGGSVALLCKYYMTFIFVIFGTMAVSNYFFAKKRGRKALLVIGCIFQALYLVLIYIFGVTCAEHVVLLASVCGIADGTYYCIYNVIEAEGIDNNSRHKLMGIYEALSASCSVLFPVISGFIISRYDMQSGVVVVLVLILASIVVATLYQDNGVSIGSRTSYFSFFKELRRTENGMAKLKYLMFNELLRGMINSFGSFTLFISIWTMLEFSQASELGLISGISYGFKMLFGLAIAKWGGKIYSKSMATYKALRVLVVVALVGMNLTNSVVFLMLMTLCLKCSDGVESPIYNVAQNTILNTGEISKYKTEFFIVLEFGLIIARIIGYSLLWFWAWHNTLVVLWSLIFIYSVILVVTPLVQNKMYSFAYPNVS